MNSKLVYGPVAAAVLGVCFLLGKGDAPAAEASAPPAPACELPHASCAHPADHAEESHAPDAVARLPVLYDYRQVVSAQDVSGLAVGTHTIELDFYAPARTGWTKEAERLVIEGVRVLHVDDQVAAATRVSFGAPSRTGARTARIEMDLDRAGSWVILLGDGLVAAHADPEMLAEYDVREPETLKPRGDYEFLHPSLMLRTVGRCNHVHKVVSKVDDTGTLHTVELHFSEPLDPRAAARTIRMGMKDSDGGPERAVETRSARVRGGVLELEVPRVHGARGALEIPLARMAGLAGGFRDTLACGEQDGSMGVGYAFGEQQSGEHIVSPLRQAAARATGEDKK